MHFDSKNGGQVAQALNVEHGLQIALKRYALSMEDKMAAGGFGRAMNYGLVCIF